MMSKGSVNAHLSFHKDSRGVQIVSIFSSDQRLSGLGLNIGGVDHR